MRPITFLMPLIFLASFFMIPATAYAGTVHSCKSSYKRLGSSQEVKTVTKCVINISQGQVGDTIEIKNQYNYIIATGKIIKKRNRYTLVVLEEVFKEVKSGYPVIVKNNDSIDHWTATTAPY